MESFIPQKGKIVLQKTQKRGSESALCDTMTKSLEDITVWSSEFC